MMELAHSLLLNEDALSRIAETKRPVFIFEWLRFLDKVLVAAQKSDIKESQQKLINQLTNQITENPGPPIRKLLARCLATIFSVGDTFSLFETINKCNDIIRNKDDSPSYLPTKLAAIACIGGMYEKLGRMVGRSYEETISLLIKALKNAESQGRCEIMLTLQKAVIGLGSAGTNCYKDIFKAARGCLTDRSLTVRCAAAMCLCELVNEASFMYTVELDNLVSLCFKAMDGSNYDVRCEVAKLLGNLLAATQSTKAAPGASKGNKQLKLEDVLNMLAAGFLRGGTGFLKAGEMIKGGTNVNRDIRVGVTHAYVEFGKCMSGIWLERNMPELLSHFFSLVSNPRTSLFHVDAVYARKCVNFMLRSLIGGQLGERAQIASAKELYLVIVKQMNVVELANSDAEKGQPAEASLTHHVLVCALQELGCLVQTLGTSSAPLVSEPSTGIIEPVVSVLLHPAPAARLAAAWCLRCIAVALPLQMTILIERCMTRMQHLKSSIEAISGYSFALAAMLGGVKETALGIPHAKGKQIFAIAEDLLRTATQNSRLSLQRTQSGWLLLGALMTLGPSVVKGHLPRMLLLWRNAFPRSTKELESEKARGDAFTWQVTLEGRAGALAAMYSFVLHCPELLTDDVTRRLLPPLECALTMTVHIVSVIKMYGTHLKASAATVRLRLYDVLSLLPPESYEGAFSSLLRELVAEFTLTDNPANTTTSLLRSMCHADDSIILGTWLQETDHKTIEDQLQPNSASGSGALEHDPASLYIQCQQGEAVPGPLPLGVAVIDSSVHLYGLVFPRVAHKHRLQMLEHFAECIKQAKSTRQQAVQINIFTAVLSALKCLAETKTGFGNVEVRKAAVDLVLGALGSSNQILRCAAGEALGRIVQVVGDGKFITEMAQYSFDRLKSARDAVTRTGHSLALGCLHRYVGGMGSGHHLNTSISILLALAQDSSSPLVQVWALHALGLIADSGGPMFRTYVEPSLSLVLQLLLSMPQSNTDVHQCLGKCLAALITTIGPELQGNTSAIATARLSCLVCCAIMQDHPDSMVQSEAISCLQQLHLFAPRHVNLTTLVPHLCETLSSPHLVLRHAVVSCLRQLVQREAQEVSDYAMTLAAENKDTRMMSGKSSLITESGLEGALFSLLDKDYDRKLCSDIQDTLISLLQTLAADHLAKWLALIKDVLQASSDASAVNTPVEEGGEGQKDDDDDEGLNIKNVDTDAQRPVVSPRWPTRVFAIECMLKIIAVCDENEAHFQLDTAKALKQKGSGDFLVLHLSELVRMAFIAATSDCDKLRLAGLAALQEIIIKFAKVPEPEFPGHVLLEQYQAQVGAALRPAFTPETAPDVTAAACEVCSRWIGSGVARDLNDLRRVHQLLVSSFAKLKDSKDAASPLYSESASTMEKLSVLKAWAEVYIVTMEEEKEQQRQHVIRSKGTDDGSDDVDEFGDYLGGGSESLLSLVQPEVKMLSKHWLVALKDYALLSLPPEYSSQMPTEGGGFYTFDTMDSSRPHYKKAWPPMLYAVSLWLKETGFTSVDKDNSRPANMKADDSDINRFHLLIGICVEALCNPMSVQPLETVNLCLKALYTLLEDSWTRMQLGSDNVLTIELLNVLHRLLLTRDSIECFGLILDVVKQIIRAAQDDIDNRRALCKEQEDKEQRSSSPAAEICGSQVTMSNEIGDGGAKGNIIPGKSLVFATLEVCLCVLVRHMPSLNPSIPSTGMKIPSLRQTAFSEANCQLLSTTLQVMTDLPMLCSPSGSVSVLPTILFLTTGVIKELAAKGVEKISPVVTVALQCLKTICTSPLIKEPSCSAGWKRYLQSAMATIIDYSKPDPEKPDKGGLEEMTSLLCLAVFLVSCPSDVVSPSNLLTPCVQLFFDAWQSGNPSVQLKCVQSLISICQHTDHHTLTPFVHTVILPIINHLVSIGSGSNSVPLDEWNCSVAIEAIRLLEMMLTVAEEQHKLHMLSLIVPVLVSLLVDQDKLHEASSYHRRLHDVSLQKLIEIGPQYRSQFLAVLQRLPELRSCFESAVKGQQGHQRSLQASSSGHSATGSAGNQTTGSSQPATQSIQLRMDFSNFTA